MGCLALSGLAPPPNLLLAFFGRLWMILLDSGKLWGALKSSGRFLKALDGFRCLGKDVEGCGRVSPHSALHLVLRGPRRCELGVGYSEWRSAGHLPTPRSTHGRPSARSAAKIISELVEIVDSSRVSACTPNTAILVLAQRVFASQI